MIFLENYAKVVLYTYPLLETVEKDYEEHIRNRAVLSYKSRLSAEELAEYLAEEILRKEKLEWLRSVVEGVLKKLSDLERALLAIRYFGKTRAAKNFTAAVAGRVTAWSEREYFRRQKRLSEKVGAMLRCAGMTKEKYLTEFAELELFKKVHRFVERDRKIDSDERRWLKNED